MSEQRGVTYIVAEIDRMRRALDLDESISMLAPRYLSQIIDAESVSIDSHDRLASTLVYITCRQNSAGVVLDEIVDVSRPPVERDEIVAKAKRIQDALPINLELKDPVEYTETFCRKLDLSEDTIDDIRSVAEKMQDENVLVNKQASTFGSALIYAYAQAEELDLTQKEITEVARVSRNTIRSNYPEVFHVMDREIPTSAEPPKSVHAGIDRIEGLSKSQADRARELFETSGYDPSAVASKAAVAGALFLVAGRRDGGITDVEQIATSVGAGQTSIRDHATSIEEVLTDD